MRRLTELTHKAQQVVLHGPKKYENKHVSAASLQPFDCSGFVRKAGGTVTTKKKRFLVLKIDTLYWFENEKASQFKGMTVLDSDTIIASETFADKTFSITVKSKNRTLWFEVLGNSDLEKEQFTREWVKAIKMAVQSVANREDSKQRFSDHGSMNSEDTTMFHEAKTIVQSFSTQPENAEQNPRRNSATPIESTSPTTTQQLRSSINSNSNGSDYERYVVRTSSSTGALNGSIQSPAATSNADSTPMIFPKKGISLKEFADQQKLSAEPLVAFSNDGTLTNVKVVRTQPGAVFGNDLKDTDYGGLPQEQSIEQPPGLPATIAAIQTARENHQEEDERWRLMQQSSMTSMMVEEDDYDALPIRQQQ